MLIHPSSGSDSASLISYQHVCQLAFEASLSASSSAIDCSLASIAAGAMADPAPTGSLYVQGCRGGNVFSFGKHLVTASGQSIDVHAPEPVQTLMSHGELTWQQWQSIASALNWVCKQAPPRGSLTVSVLAGVQNGDCALGYAVLCTLLMCC